MASKRLQATITIGGAIAGSLRTAIGSARDGMGSIGAAIKQVEVRQKELTRVLENHTRVGKAGSELAMHYARLELDALTQKLARLKQIEAIDRKRSANAAARSEVGGKLTGTVIGAAIAAVPIVGATRAAAGWEYELQLIGNTADMTKDKILELGAEIMRVSKETGQSATNTRKAMGFLIAAGLDVNVARGALANIGRTATATGGDIEDISKAAFTLIDTLKIKPGKDLQDALDTLAQAGKEGNVELKDMAKVLPVLGSGFQALKMGGREAAASMGAALEIARKGAADADEAANNVKNYIAKVMSPETLKKAKKNFNLDLYAIISDAQKTGKNPFDESLKAIMKATKGDQKAIGELFQDMQVQNFIRPMIQNWDEYIRIKQKALAADGVIERDFGKMRETSQQQMAEAANSAGRLAIIVGTALLPALVSVLQAITPVVESMADFARENPKLIAGIIGVVGGLVALRVATLAVMWGFTAVKGAWLAMAAVGARLGPILAFLGRTALPLIGQALMFIARALLLNPIGLAITAIAGGAYLIYKNWEPIKSFFVDLWSTITSATGKAVDFVMGKLSTLGDAIKTYTPFGLVNQAMQLGSRAGEALAGDLPTVPAMAQASGAGGNTATQNNNFTIVQQPGQDAKQLAEEVAKRIKQRSDVEQRSVNYDAMGNAW